MRKIGIMGGTFDPIHSGHLMLGQQAYEEYGLDCVWFMPSRQPPHKQSHQITSARQRLEMVRLAVSRIPYFASSDFELRRMGGNTYTADTLRLLRQEYPDTEFYFIVGADSIFDIEKWYHPEIVMKNAVLLAADRPCGHDNTPLDQQISRLSEKYGARICRLHSRRLDVSSEHLREMIRRGTPVSSYIPEEVEAFIRQNRLYKKEDDAESAQKNRGGRQ